MVFSGPVLGPAGGPAWRETSSNRTVANIWQPSGCVKAASWDHREGAKPRSASYGFCESVAGFRLCR